MSRRRARSSSGAFLRGRGQEELLALKLPFLAAPVGPASAPGLRAAVRRGVRRRLRGGASRRGSPHLVGSKTQRRSWRAVRAHEATAGRARPTQALPWGSTINSGRNSSAALPRVTEHP